MNLVNCLMIGDLQNQFLKFKNFHPSMLFKEDYNYLSFQHFLEFYQELLVKNEKNYNFLES